MSSRKDIEKLSDKSLNITKCIMYNMYNFETGVIFGFFASVFGSFFMWVVVGNYIVKRRIERELREFSGGKYDAIIEEAAKKGVIAIIKDPELNKSINGMIHGYAKSFADQSGGMFVKFIQDKFGVTSDTIKQYLPAGGGNPLDPQKLIERLIGSILPE